MKSKYNFIVILIAIIISSIYICISCVFFIEFNRGMNSLNKFEVKIFTKQLSIEKLIILSTIFVVFITILFISSIINMQYINVQNCAKMRAYQSKYVNAQMQNHLKETAMTKLKKQKENVDICLLEYTKEHDKILKEMDKIKENTHRMDNKFLNIVSQIKDLKMQINNSYSQIEPNDIINIIEELFTKIKSVYCTISDYSNIVSGLENLKETANDISINSAIEHTKLRKRGIENEALLLFSSSSRKIYESFICMNSDLDILKNTLDNQIDDINSIVSNLKNLYIYQNKTSGKLVKEFSDIINDIEELSFLDHKADELG